MISMHLATNKFWWEMFVSEAANLRATFVRVVARTAEMKNSPSRRNPRMTGL